MMEELAEAYDTAALHPTIRIITNEEPHNEHIEELIIPHEQVVMNDPSTYQQLTLTLLTPQDNAISDKATARLLQTPWSLANTVPTNIRIHVDGGANRSITNDRNLLIRYRNIKKYPMSGVAAGEPALVCTGLGYIPWQDDNGDTVFVKCYYSEHAAETIVSPNDIVTNQIHDFISWGQYSNIDTGIGRIEFHRRNQTSPLVYTLTSNNGLWYYNNQNDNTDYPTWVSRCLHGKPVIRRLSKAAEYHLYHFRYGCAGERDLSSVHHHVDNQPKLYKHAFFKCETCCRTSGEYQMPDKEDNPNVPADVIDWLYDVVDQKEDTSLPGQHFGVDFGFMKGSGYCKKDEEGRTITSIDGFRSYLLIIDHKTRYTWIFLTKTKQPPVKIFDQFLKEHGHPTAHHRTIRCDKGGELWGSQTFRQVLLNHGYIMEPTAPQAPYQNGKAERPNRTFGKMVNSLLYNAGLGPEYWSFAILHAVYLKNRRIHRGTNQVPLTQYTGKRPNARRLRIFGCPVIVRNLGKKAAKLDLHTSAGRFLGYTATDKNIIFMDSVTKRIKTATHVVFDEAGMTLPANDLPPSAKILQGLGYAKEEQEADDESELPITNDIQDYRSTQDVTTTIQHETTPNAEDLPKTTNTTNSPATPNLEPTIQIKRLSEQAKLPCRATDGSVGYDLYSAQDATILPNTRMCIPLDLSIIPPPGTYGQIFSRSGLAAKHSMDVCAGTIDPDYTGNIQVLLENNSNEPYQVRIGERIAQMIFLQAQTPPITQVNQDVTSSRGGHGFGSTGKDEIILHPLPENTETPAIVHNLTATDTAIDTPIPQQNEPAAQVFEKPFELYFSGNPFDDTLEIEIPIKGDHPTLGMLTKLCEYRQRLQIKDMALSTPGSRLKCWRTVIRNAYILKFQEFAITSEEDLMHAISQVRKRKMLKAKFVIATDRSYGVHPLEGILQIHFDQMNVIAKHLEDIERERQEMRIRNNLVEPVIRQTQEVTTITEGELPPPEPPPSLIPDADLAQQFSMKQAMNHVDWPEFKKGQYKQLNQYWDQGMFSYPMPLPRNANALQMLWRFNIKACGTRKSRMVCNGSPRQKGTVTIGHTYANALDAASERLFWALVASEGLIAIGADVSNAFAEAPAPKAPLFLYIDDSFRDWWVNHLKKEPIPKECNVVRVNNAIQGHPESPRLWEKHIDKILGDLGLTPAVHEPCIYSGVFNNNRVLFLRQVDDFAVASTDRQTAANLIDAINAQMRIEVKHLGTIDRFNGVDVHQTRYYVKITCEKYLYKMIKAHDWLLKTAAPLNPVPLPADSAYIKKLESAVVPNTLTDKLKLKESMGFNYRQVIGEVIFPMMKCRPEIAPHAIKLSQYMENPAAEHYNALRDLVAYLAATIDDGIYYWRKKPVMELPVGPTPKQHNDNYLMPDKIQ